MAVVNGSGKIKNYAWAMNEVGKDNFSAGAMCTQASAKGKIQECVKKIKEEKETRKAEALEEKVEEFREIFGEDEEERE